MPNNDSFDAIKEKYVKTLKRALEIAKKLNADNPGSQNDRIKEIKKQIKEFGKDEDNA